MKIAIWKTGHPIADTVADALREGLNGEKLRIHNFNCELFDQYTTHMVYGILRGGTEVFREADKRGFGWFNVDRGYFNPSHFDGYYRISYKGTQARYDPAFPTKEFEIDLEPIKKGTYIMICPPTDHVCDFFGIDPKQWMWEAAQQANKLGLPYWKRTKDCPIPLEEHFKDCAAVITFNSSVGWQALQRGIPCFSDPLHSVVGSYYNTISIDECIEKFNTMPRKPLFNFMRSHQFTLEEIRRGCAWNLVNHYLSKSSSDTIAEKQLPPTLQHIQYESALKRYFQSNI